MLRAICWICGSALLIGIGTANAVGYCVPEWKKYSHEEAFLFVLQDAVNSRPYIIPKIKSAEDARTYMNENPDCCRFNYQKNPIPAVTGLYKGAYTVHLPRTGGPENLHTEFTYVLNNCFGVRKIWEIGLVIE